MDFSEKRNEFWRKVSGKRSTKIRMKVMILNTNSGKRKEKEERK